MPSRRALLGGLALGVGAPLLAACGGSDDAGDRGSDDGGGLQEMTFLSVIPLPNIANSPELVADASGLFRKQGLKVNFQNTQGSSPAIQTVIAGGALLTKIGDIETIIAIAEKNAPLVNVGGVEKEGLLRFLSSKRKPLQSPEDFRGATMGLPSSGGTSERTLDLVLASAGIKKEEVKRQVVGLQPGVFELVKAGRIDGYVVSLDTSLTVLKANPEAVSFAPSSVISAGTQLYATSTQQLKDSAKQRQIRGYLQAVADAIQFIIDDEANGFTKTMDLVKRYEVPSLKDPEVATGALKEFVKSWTADGRDKIVHTNPQTWQATYDELVKSGLVAGGKDPAQWLNNDFAPKVA
ncbi:MAG: ABC transporter substrate-binding protein [Micromonosporaceae bacterium]|jgi:NitT/TauT family transport system substrate-binding protein|nr:ABC transporter substrate-binding protein [Micromonosporaceae bacterium]